MLKVISLKNQKEFNAANKAGQKFYTKHFIFIFCKSPSSRESASEGRDKLFPLDDRKHIYLGLKVSRKVGNAVTRNKIKRRFREIARELAQENPKLAGSTFVFIPKQSIISIAYKEILEDIKDQINKTSS